MKNGFRLILYFFLILIIISGILFLVFNEQADSYFQNSSGLEVVLPTTTQKIISTNSIDTQILDDPRLQTLINNVVNFNFDNICRRPDTSLSRPLDSFLGSANSSSTLQTPQQINCHQGNGLPFMIKKTK